MKQVAFRLSDGGGPEGDRTLGLTDANRTLSQRERLHNPCSLYYFFTYKSRLLSIKFLISTKKMALNGNLPIQSHLFISYLFFTFRSALNGTGLQGCFSLNCAFHPPCALLLLFIRQYGFVAKRTQIGQNSSF